MGSSSLARIGGLRRERIVGWIDRHCPSLPAPLGEPYPRLGSVLPKVDAGPFHIAVRVHQQPATTTDVFTYCHMLFFLFAYHPRHSGDIMKAAAPSAKRLDAIATFVSKTKPTKGPARAPNTIATAVGKINLDSGAMALSPFA